VARGIAPALGDHGQSGGFYIHASVFVLVNIGLFVINALTSCSRAGYGGFTKRFWAEASAWEHTLWASSVGRDWEERKTREMMDKEGRS
jgi:2TM domain